MVPIITKSSNKLKNRAFTTKKINSLNLLACKFSLNPGKKPKITPKNVVNIVVR